MCTEGGGTGSSLVDVTNASLFLSVGDIVEQQVDVLMIRQCSS